MDSSSLQTAATYINNLLLARGLLRNGTPVEFMQLARKKEESNTPLGQIINLVHDLILRRDRDQSHQEELASSLRTLQSDAHNNTSSTDRLTARNKELERQLALAQGQTRHAQSALHTAEASARSLRDEMVKVKSTLVQVRKQCENDVRKRDVQMQRLKTHLSTQQRGGSQKTAVVGPSITINSGAGTRSGRDAGKSASSGALPGEDEYPSLEDAEYSLKQETTEFLTQLSQGLSDENDSLLGLLRSTVATLKELQGIQQQTANHVQSVGDHGEGDSMVSVVPASYGELASDLEGVLGHLRDLLTNPSFAPIEEVQLREDEILRLRQGWEKMENRWQEAVGMMDGWRKRMMSGGDTVNIEELKMGLGLGNGLEALGPAKGAVGIDDTEDISIHSNKDEPDVEALAQDLPSDEEDALPKDRAGPALFDPPADPSLQERDLNINIGPKVTTRDRKPSHKTASKVPRKASARTEPASSTASNQAVGSLKRARPSPLKSTHNATPRKNSFNAPLSPTPALTVSQKLALAAEAARQTSNSPPSSPLDLGPSPTPSPQDKRRRLHESPVKRTRISGRPVRRPRRSTLSPEELEDLLVGVV